MRGVALAVLVATCGCGPAGSAGDLNAKIAAHPFWKVRVTPAQVAALVEKIRAEKGHSIVYVDDHFRYGIAQGTDDATTRAFIDTIGPDDYRPKSLGARAVHIDLYKSFASRPSPEQVAERLLAAVSAREYQD